VIRDTKKTFPSAIAIKDQSTPTLMAVQEQMEVLGGRRGVSNMELNGLPD
jgi:hypothetical protein